MEYLKFFGIGILDGAIAGLLGIGGGVLIIPILLYIANTEVKIATAISAVQVFFASSFGTLFNYLQKTINFRYAVIFGLSSGVTYFFGSYFTQYIPGVTIKIIYLCVVVLAIILFFIKKNNKGKNLDNETASTLILAKKAYFKTVGDNPKFLQNLLISSNFSFIIDVYSQFSRIITSDELGSQLEHLLAFSIASKGLLTSYSRVFPFNLKFESKKLISCLFCSIFELSKSS